MKLDKTLEALLGGVREPTPEERRILVRDASDLPDVSHMDAVALARRLVVKHLTYLLGLPPDCMSRADSIACMKAGCVAMDCLAQHPEPARAPEAFDATAVRDAIAAAIGTMPN